MSSWSASSQAGETDGRLGENLEVTAGPRGGDCIWLAGWVN